jgi:hypothetical protein
MFDSAKYEASLKAMPDLMELDFDLDKTEYCTLDEARDWCKENGINSQSKYREVVTGGVYNSDGKKLPSAPSRYYKILWSKFFGKEERYTGDYTSLEECKNWCKENEINTREKYREVVNGGVYNSDGKKLPGGPNKKYKISWNEFFEKSEYCSLDEARDWCKLNVINSVDKYDKAVNGGVYNSNGKKLPSHPYQKYKNTGWVSWPDLWK